MCLSFERLPCSLSQSLVSLMICVSAKAILTAWFSFSAPRISLFLILESVCHLCKNSIRVEEQRVPVGVILQIASASQTRPAYELVYTHDRLTFFLLLVGGLLLLSHLLVVLSSPHPPQELLLLSFLHLLLHLLHSVAFLLPGPCIAAF